MYDVGGSPFAMLAVEIFPRHGRGAIGNARSCPHAAAASLAKLATCQLIMHSISLLVSKFTYYAS